MVKIHGFQKMTLLDYPGKVACTIFLGACNFRCPFCHNGSLVLAPEKEPLIPVEDVWKVLKKRQGILDGVCITGGEPTLSVGLMEFIEQIKEMNYLVKLDTNGARPEVIKELLDHQLLDYIAMDIKNSPEKYAQTAGITQVDMNKINESVELLKSNVVDYEFRTTVMKELHEKEDFERISEWLAGSKRYFLQTYKETELVICPGFSSYSKDELEKFVQIARQTIAQVEIRGV
ncbi:MAG: anaerobic ribonucleoside-triphosphate reductase activating protein [Ruminococcus sp.]|nr:anaerobic ribonucleoside-triphosphate reductase activating protein [Ruminococcus sp.]